MKWLSIEVRQQIEGVTRVSLLVSIAPIFLQPAKNIMEDYIHKCTSQHQTKYYMNTGLLVDFASNIQ